MRKIKMCAMTLFIAMGIMLFVSCTSSSTSGGPTETYATGADVRYYLITSGDFLDVFDVSIQYKNASGTVVSETITSNNYVKEITKVPLPFKTGMKFNVSIKSNVSTTSTYNVYYSYGTVYVADNNDGSQTIVGGSPSLTGGTKSYTALQTLANKLNSYSEASLMTLANGAVTVTDTTIDF